MIPAKTAKTNPKHFKTPKNTKATEIIGWIGVMLLLINYLLLSLGVLHSEKITFHAISVLGCIFMAFEAWIKHDKQPVVLNVIFCAMGAYAIIRITSFL